MPDAEILTIGTELLLGEIVDTNTRDLARGLRGLGIDVRRTQTVGDNRDRIAAALRESADRAAIVVAAGGLGPTVDDVTRDAFADAFGRPLEFHPDLWAQIEQRFRRFEVTPTENNVRQAFVPAGALVLENPVGTAPCFALDAAGSLVIALPGVPGELLRMWSEAVEPLLRQRFGLSDCIRVRVLHTAGVGESQIDARIADLAGATNPTVGLSAHPGQVDVRITAKARTASEAEAMLAEAEDRVRERIGRWIYGADDSRLEAVALGSVATAGGGLASVEARLGGLLAGRLAAIGDAFVGGEVLAGLADAADLERATTAYRLARRARFGLGAALFRRDEDEEICIVFADDVGARWRNRRHVGPRELAPERAVNLALDFLRTSTRRYGRLSNAGR